MKKLARVSFLTHDESISRPPRVIVMDEWKPQFINVEYTTVLEYFAKTHFCQNRHKYGDQNLGPEATEKEIMKCAWKRLPRNLGDQSKAQFSKKFWSYIQNKNLVNPGRLSANKDIDQEFVLEILFEDGTWIHHEIDTHAYQVSQEDLYCAQAAERNRFVESNNPLDVPIHCWTKELLKQWFSRASRGRKPGDPSDPGYIADPELGTVLDVTKISRTVTCTFINREGEESAPMNLPLGSVYPNPRYKIKIDEFVALCDNCSV
jgi:Fe-S cluster biosynthesis and repair protein YggX